jgi:lipopolysaccharide transport system ATP-binding protein
MSDVAVRVEGLGKEYRIGGKQDSYRTLRDSLSDAIAAPFRRARGLLRGQAYGAAGLEETIWALKDVSFEVKRGEVVGIIGRNGAGKSTLLKVLSRITGPTEGYVEVFGRVGSLLEVGTGFHPELTGRENVYLNGAILGMSREEIARKFDEIVDFAGIERFIDTPVKYYSSGMGLRLGFAVAAHLEPEILLVDEVLAVGDAEFQKKCIGKMGDVAGQGRTVLFVSHNMAAVSNLCDRIVWLQNGQVETIGNVNDTIQAYLSSIQGVEQTNLAQRTDRTGSGEIQFAKIWLEDGNCEIIDHLVVGNEVNFMFEYVCKPGQSLRNMLVTLVVRDNFEQRLFSCSTHLVGTNFDSLSGQGVIVCHIPRLPLTPGIYSIDIWASNKTTPCDYVIDAHRFNVIEGDFFGSGKLPNPSKHGVFLVDHSWRQVNSRAFVGNDEAKHATDSAFLQD